MSVECCQAQINLKLLINDEVRTITIRLMTYS